MTVQIAPSVEDQIENLVATGRYADASDVVEQAVALLRQRDHNRRIIDSVREAEMSILRGEGILLTDDLAERIEERAHEMDRLGLAIDPDVCP